ncbi:hypothetical protein PsorP6_012797 [Peronosclerospora sorghi]|uniref:Uncharacterized protein n=1 Tax=Peronosclerospora sorghi TaxID=230839 RepID=A0ACC0WHG7_9STRA|nr:hypothetical protein PsorP6_012797 [Peronosclerospora sorghi]
MIRDVQLSKPTALQALLSSMKRGFSSADDDASGTGAVVIKGETGDEIETILRSLRTLASPEETRRPPSTHCSSTHKPTCRQKHKLPRQAKTRPDWIMKFTAFVVTMLAATADFTLAADYQPALRPLATPEPVAPNAAAEPSEDKMQPQPAAADAGKNHEWWGGYGRGGAWGGYGGWECCG